MAIRREKKAPNGKQGTWYASGLRFECRPDCGGCCTNHGDYAYVYVEPDEMRRLATFLEMTLAEFRKTYTTLDDGYRVLVMNDPDCPFLEGGRCTVYPARPVQCRTFPFWRENLRSRYAWKKLSSFCPGIGEGDVQPLHVIQGHLDARTDE